MKVMEKLKLFIDAHIDDFRNGVNTEYVNKIDIGFNVDTVHTHTHWAFRMLRMLSALIN